MTDPDAVVVGSGPNGLVAAVVLAKAGLNVLVLEAGSQPGGGTRSEELALPGVVHDVCSAIHPLALASPILRELPLAEQGLEWIHPEIPLAHPLDGGRAAVLHRSLRETTESLGDDGGGWGRMFGPLVEAGFGLTDNLLSPLSVPRSNRASITRYGSLAIRPARGLARRRLHTDEGRALFAGLAGHSMLSLSQPVTSGYALMLGTLGHLVGWPMARGGSRNIAGALIGLLEDYGGQVECDRRITDLDDLPTAKAVLFDVTPRQLLEIAGPRLPHRYRRALERYRYGPGVFKMDWVLDGPIPWTNEACARAGTIHLGGTLDEIAAAEAEVQRGHHPQCPYVILAQPTLFDDRRAPAGTHTAWAYCHVPNGSTIDMTQQIEGQIERFAPGFKDRIVARHTMATPQVQRHNANYIGGDINGGVADLRQFVARPTLGLHPWRLPVDGLYLCSSSTPPGGGVHGMCGWHAAQEVLRAWGRSQD